MYKCVWVCACIHTHKYVYKLDIMPNNANSKSAHGDKVTVIVRITTWNFLSLVQIEK